MLITYLAHSGFHVELETCCLLFDYYQGNIPQSDKPLYVFVSHAHDDHFVPFIAELDATFIVDKEVPLQGRNVYFVEANHAYTVNDLHIQTLPSTDEGVAYVVEVENKTIYHAGDLHLWHWEGEEDWDNDLQESLYKQALQPIQGKVIDVAFVVLDPRLEKYYAKGLHYFIETMHPKQVFPMHMWEMYSIVDTYQEEYPQDAIIKITKKQERFVI